MNICICSEPLPEHEGSGRKPHYCSDTCKQKAYRKRIKRNAPTTAYTLRNPYKKPVLSLFPGIGLLDQAFEEHGFCIVRGPDLLWGGDIHTFHPPSGYFGGIIGGPPCQAFSRLRYLVEYNGHQVAPNLIPEYERCIQEAQPDWFLMENVPAAPIPHVEGYTVQSMLLNNRSFSAEQYRQRRISFGSLTGLQLHIEKDRTEKKQKSYTVLSGWPAPGQRKKQSPKANELGYTTKASLTEAKRLQGLPEDFNLPGMTVEGAFKAIGNGVPLPLGRAIAMAVREALIPSIKDK